MTPNDFFHSSNFFNAASRSARPAGDSRYAVAAASSRRRRSASSRSRRSRMTTTTAALNSASTSLLNLIRADTSGDAIRRNAPDTSPTVMPYSRM